MDFNEICEYDSGLLIKKSTGKVYGSIDTDGYIRTTIQGVKYRVHRIIWEMLKGKIPEGMEIDHIDGNKGNNRIENLRLATPAQNTANRESYGKYPKGVKAQGDKFQARIGYAGKRYHLGTFNTIEEAKAAYDAKAFEFHGEFYRP